MFIFSKMAFSDVEYPWSWLYREEVKCTCCSDQINPFGVWYEHPVLKTVQCSECNKFYTNGELIFTKSKKLIHLIHILIMKYL